MVRKCWSVKGDINMMHGLYKVRIGLTCLGK